MNSSLEPAKYFEHSSPCHMICDPTKFYFQVLLNSYEILGRDVRFASCILRGLPRNAHHLASIFKYSEPTVPAHSLQHETHLRSKKFFLKQTVISSPEKQHCFH